MPMRTGQNALSIRVMRAGHTFLVETLLTPLRHIVMQCLIVRRLIFLYENKQMNWLFIPMRCSCVICDLFIVYSTNKYTSHIHTYRIYFNIQMKAMLRKKNTVISQFLKFAVGVAVLLKLFDNIIYYDF